MFKRQQRLVRFSAGLSLLALSAGLGGITIANEKEDLSHLPIPETLGGLKVDIESTKAIREATTEARFLNDWVSAMPDHPTIPSPRDFLGHIAGAESEMTNVDEIHAYMRAIAAATDRAKVVSLGLTAEGREQIAIAIADPEVLAKMDEFAKMNDALSDPRKTSEAEAEAIIKDLKPIYYITTGLHSTEYGPPETAMEIAYRVAAEERELFQNVRKNVITMITPVFEVDGRNRSTEWFLKHNKGRKDYYNRPPSGPPFWGKYTFHDNNRDGIGLTQPMTKNYLQHFLKYKPILSLDLHESVPYLYVATGTGPYNPGVSATTVSEWASIANYEVSRLTGKGMPGVWTWGFYTGWWPGYMLWVTNNRNANGRFYETFGNGGSETMLRDLSDSSYAGDKVVDKTWYRPSPPAEQTLWSMRNNLNYMSSGVYASLEYAAKNGADLLRNYYAKGQEAVAAGAKADDANAVVIPMKQRDPGAARELVDLIIEQAIEVHVADDGGRYGDLKVEKGDLIIRLDQPYGPFAKTLFDKQSFPEDAQVPPYDDVAWTMSYLRGVDAKLVSDTDILKLDVDPISSGADAFKPANVRKANVYAVAHKAQEGLGELRFALPMAKMFATKADVKVGGKTYPAGSIFIEGDSVDLAALNEVVGRTLLPVDGLRSMPKGDMIEMDVPRIGLLHSWISTQDPGWVRYSFDMAKVPFSIIEKDELKAGNLNDKYDVIVAPSFGRRGSLRALINGVDSKWSPLAYETTEETPSHGRIVSSSDITGGFGFDGMASLEAFIKQGGTFVGLGSGGSLVAESGIASDIGMSNPAVNTPGSVITMKITNPSSPLVYGYDNYTHAFRGNVPFYRVGKDDHRDMMVAQFGTKEASVRPWLEGDAAQAKPANKPLVLSGGILRGKGQLNGAPAIVKQKVGEGRVVVYGWNPMHRHLNHHDHGFVYNALMFWNDID